MYRKFIFRFFCWFLLFSFLNLQLAPFATAGKGLLEGDPPSTTSFVSFPKPSASADSEAGFVLSPRQSFLCTETDQLPDLSLIAATLQSFPWYVDKEKNVRFAQRVMMGIRGVEALFYGFAYALLFLNDSNITALLIPNTENESALTNSQLNSLIGASAFAAMWSSLQSYLLLAEPIQLGTLRAAFRQWLESDYLKRVLTLFVGTGFVACMTVKPAFAYVTNVSADLQALAVAGLVALGPYAIITLLKEARNFGQFWFPTWEGMNTKIREIRGFGAEEKEAKKTLRHHLAQGLRKLIATPSEAAVLEKKFKEIQEALDSVVTR